MLLIHYFAGVRERRRFEIKNIFFIVFQSRVFCGSELREKGNAESRHAAPVGTGPVLSGQ